VRPKETLIRCGSAPRTAYRPCPRHESNFQPTCHPRAIPRTETLALIRVVGSGQEQQSSRHAHPERPHRLAEYSCLTELILMTAPGRMRSQCSPKVTGKNLDLPGSLACRRRPRRLFSRGWRGIARRSCGAGRDFRRGR
jgi:hypothetical protein